MSLCPKEHQRPTSAWEGRDAQNTSSPSSRSSSSLSIIIITIMIMMLVNIITATNVVSMLIPINWARVRQDKNHFSGPEEKKLVKRKMFWGEKGYEEDRAGRQAIWTWSLASQVTPLTICENYFSHSSLPLLSLQRRPKTFWFGNEIGQVLHFNLPKVKVVVKSRPIQ